MERLAAGDYRLAVEPARGGSILTFDWRGQPVMRPVCGPGILDVACFPLVPFSNRIGFGRFDAGRQAVTLPPNCPAADPVHPLHGFGWLAEWDVVDASETTLVLAHDYPGGDWPWPYRATQTFRLDDAAGLDTALAVTNLGDTAMPAGLGLHPYFSRDPDTVYHGLHRAEWRNGADRLPAALDQRTAPIDWWNGAPVGSRAVDTVYAGRTGPLAIRWPNRDLQLTITSADIFAWTVVYTPAGADFFCVEPVSHPTDAVNGAPDAMAWLEPGQTLRAANSFRATALG